MSYTDNAVEQVLHLSLEGAEVAIRITGEAAKALANLLCAVLRDQRESRGKASLTSMLRSGKELKIFAVKDEELLSFVRHAKQYGIHYCVLKDKEAQDGITDLMIHAEDAARVNRILERYHFSCAELAGVAPDAREPVATTSLPASPEAVPAPEKPEVRDRVAEIPEPEVPRQSRPETQENDFVRILARGMEREGNPTEARTVSLSAHSFGRSDSVATRIRASSDRRPSVRRELAEIQLTRKRRKRDRASRQKEKQTRQKEKQR